ncbi:hypothetical protein LAZ67_2004932, partial [Cordylochernes scorpioides]
MDKTPPPPSPFLEDKLVHRIAQATLSIDGSTTFVPLSGEFTLTCRVPLPGVHLWFKDGRPIVPNAFNQYLLEQDIPTHGGGNLIMRLRVEQAQALHTGEYKCSSNSPHSHRIIVLTVNNVFFFLISTQPYQGIKLVKLVDGVCRGRKPIGVCAPDSLIETNEEAMGGGVVLDPLKPLVLQCNVTACADCVLH